MRELAYEFRQNSCHILVFVLPQGFQLRAAKPVGKDVATDGKDASAEAVRNLEVVRNLSTVTMHASVEKFCTHVREVYLAKEDA